MSNLITSAGIPVVVLQGLIGNDVPSAPFDTIGQRPSAQLLSIGTNFFALDARQLVFVGVHPYAPSLRIWVAYVEARNTRGVASGAGVTSSRLGVYVPGVGGTGVFTQATVAGQFCNSASGSTVGGGASMLVILTSVQILTIGVGGLTIGQEFMVDSTGQAIPFVAGGGNIALGYSCTTGNAGDGCTVQLYGW